MKRELSVIGLNVYLCKRVLCVISLCIPLLLISVGIIHSEEGTGSISGSIKKPANLTYAILPIDEHEQECNMHKIDENIDQTTGEYTIKGLKPGVYDLFLAVSTPHADMALFSLRAVNITGVAGVPTEKEKEKIKQFFASYGETINKKQTEKIMTFYSPAYSEENEPILSAKQNKIAEWLKNLKDESFSTSAQYIVGNDAKFAVICCSRFKPSTLPKWMEKASQEIKDDFTKNFHDIFFLEKEKDGYKITKIKHLNNNQADEGNYPFILYQYVINTPLSGIRVVEGQTTRVNDYDLPNALLMK